MEKIGLNQLRSLFQEFYKAKEHFPGKSFSLIPEKDKSLLLINSGMAPLKPYFAGTDTPPAKRMTTCQKCIRTGDIDNVGYTSRHATFFEMLGSFSFGDYFKKESLNWGWEFITEVLKIPVDKLWATIYLEDEEAHDLWSNEIGMPEEKIVRLGKDDNFWEIGTGPCGPCSEIYYDRGEKYGCDNPDCKPGCDCDRYVEFWNHVFTQFNRDDAGNYTPLAYPNIDTGMGLERLACIMQGVESIFDIDTIRAILEEVVRVSNTPYKNGQLPSDVSIRIITDHIRAVTFLIGDGVLPSNEGRGYVLRRLLRRAARHGRLLGMQEAFLADLSNKVIEVSSIAYEELEEKREYIHKILTIEEEKFATTIDQGNHILKDYIKQLKKDKTTILDGEKAFKLYDTYGFPVELTAEILAEEGCTVDMESFEAYMGKQKEQARSARKSDTEVGWADDSVDFAIMGSSQFTGYETLDGEGEVKAIFWDKKPLNSISEGDTARVILDKTPFYAESGGQAWDIGVLYNDSCQLQVESVIKFKDVFAHKVNVISGSLYPGDKVTCLVDTVTRNNTARNHTATHLLHKALQEVLGSHVKQAGSAVTADSLRFDFTHFEAISKSDILKIENIVNDKVSEFLPVTVEEQGLKDALNSGVTGLFDEKYGNIVRVVTVQDFSRELCGGTHVSNSGQIGAFKIISENGVAAGVRRIEAITGTKLYHRICEDEALINQVCEPLKINKSALIAKIQSLTEELKTQKKEIEEFRKKSLGSMTDHLIEKAEDINGIKLVTQKFDDYQMNDLRNMSDTLRAEHKSIVMVFATITAGKVTFLVSISDDLLDKGYHAGNMIKEIAAVAGGSGGGKADMAQAGAKDSSKVTEAFTVAGNLIRNMS